MKRKVHEILGRLGVWLCDRYYPRPCTRGERASALQYVGAVIAYMELHGGHDSVSTKAWFLRQYGVKVDVKPQTDLVQ